MALGLAEQLNLFLPPQPISPIQLAKLQGKAPARLGRNRIMVKEETPEW